MQQATVKTAALLAPVEQQRLIDQLAALLGEAVECTFEHDPTLIGGFRAYCDGVLYDMSMQTKLEEMRSAAEAAAQAGGFYSETISENFLERLAQMDVGARSYEYGIVKSSADGVVHIDGLGDSKYGEILSFENNVFGMALDLSIHGVGAVLFSGEDAVSAGSVVRGTGRVLDVKVGSALLGRVVDPLGRPLDGKPLVTKRLWPLENPAPSIMDRTSVHQPLQTGILSVDSMIPIGKGQRELIIGDRQMGKTAIAVSAMLSQSKKGVICVYCAIGQKAASVAQLIRTLEDNGALENSIIVAATASDSSAMQYIAPYAGCAIAEYFMNKGRDVLVVYDDLSKHATAYRTMSLLLKRPPGREAYPGDVFYLHSRLLERAAKLSPERGGGSMTALPIVETMAGDISAYIPTNVISITDGQIYLESELFHAGVRPAVNVGLSVSRVGRAAQPAAMKKVSGALRLALAQYRELSVFAQFDSDIDYNTRKMLDQGERLTELLKQDQSTVFALSDQVAVLLAYQQGMFDGFPMKDVCAVRKSLCDYLHKSVKGTLDAIDNTGDLSDADKTSLLMAIENYRKLYTPAAKEEANPYA